MTIQEAAYQLLHEQGNPLPSKELARRALERGMVSSSALSPVDSLAQTVEKNIRDGVYNRPELAFIHTPSGRCIALHQWNDAQRSQELEAPSSPSEKPDPERVSARIPSALADQLRLATQAKLWPNFDTTVASLIRRGLDHERRRMRDALLKQLESDV